MSTVVANRTNTGFDPVVLTFRTADPSSQAGAGLFYWKDIGGGVHEAFLLDPDTGDDLIQVTDGDNLNAAAVLLALADLTDVSGKTGSGATVVMASSPSIDNPTLVTPTIASFVNAGHDHSNAANGGTFSIVNLSDISGVTGSGATAVLASAPTIVSPTIVDFANATHDHEAAAGGGTVSILNATTGTLSLARGGTGQTAAQGAINALAGFTTKGSLLVGSGSNMVEFAVATNTWVLTADSTQATGMKWAAPVATFIGLTDTPGAWTSGVPVVAVNAAKNAVEFVAVTGTGNVVRATSPTIVTPTIADFTNAPHDHSNAAGGATFSILNLSDVTAVTGSGATVVMASAPTIDYLTVTGTGTFASGTGALPSITFTGNTGTGFSLIGANELRISTSGNKVATFTAARQIGLGKIEASEILKDVHAEGVFRSDALPAIANNTYIEMDSLNARLDFSKTGRVIRNSWTTSAGTGTLNIKANWTASTFRITFEAGSATKNIIHQLEGGGVGTYGAYKAKGSTLSQEAWLVGSATPWVGAHSNHAFYIATNNADRIHLLNTGEVIINGTAIIGTEQFRVIGDVYFDNDLTCSGLTVNGAFNHDGATFGALTAVPAAQQSVTALTDNSGGAANDTIAVITNAANAGSADVGPTQDAIADLAAKVNALRGIFNTFGFNA